MFAVGGGDWLLLSEQAQALLGVSRVIGDLDMIFARDLTAKERTQVEDLVLQRFNEAMQGRVVKGLKWSPLTRKDCDFGGGWDSDSRFETLFCDIAAALYAGGDVRPLFHFLVDMSVIAPLEQVWVCVEAPVAWFVDWHEELDGEFGHYSIPAYVVFKRVPTDAQRQRIDRVFGFEGLSDDERESEGKGMWDPADELCLGVISSDAEFSPHALLEQLERAQKIVPVKVAGIGVVVNL